LSTPENVHILLSLIDKVAGSKIDTQNVFDIEDLLGKGQQMQKCLEAVLSHPAYQWLCLLGSFLSFATDAPNKENEAPLAYNFDLITQGIRIARQAKPLFPIKFEEGLDRPIEEWRT
jgi:hypothetical protein